MSRPIGNVTPAERIGRVVIGIAGTVFGLLLLSSTGGGVATGLQGAASTNRDEWQICRTSARSASDSARGWAPGASSDHRIPCRPAGRSSNAAPASAGTLRTHPAPVKASWQPPSAHLVLLGRSHEGMNTELAALKAAHRGIWAAG